MRRKSSHVAHTHSVALNLGHFWTQLVFLFPGVIEKIPGQEAKSVKLRSNKSTSSASYIDSSLQGMHAYI